MQVTYVRIVQMRADVRHECPTFDRGKAACLNPLEAVRCHVIQGDAYDSTASSTVSALPGSGHFFLPLPPFAVLDLHAI